MYEIIAKKRQNVYVMRGSVNIKKGVPGCYRRIKAEVLSCRDDGVRIKLLEDDPMATVDPFEIGEEGFYPWSCIVFPKKAL